jgi:hypothetical protein
VKKLHSTINLLLQRKDKQSLLKNKFLLFLCFILFSLAAKADVDKMRLSSEQIQVIFEYQIDVNKGINDSTEVVRVKFRRGKAILFTIFTGFLGGHRIYFGTHHRTPIIYSLTFGGLGILPLIDLIHIIFTKDLDKFQDKSQIIMWGK